MQINLQLSRRFLSLLSIGGFVFALAFVIAPASRAQDSVVHVDPAQTKIGFTLGSTLHTVHGKFVLKSSAIHVDPAGGKISGVIVVDATSGESGNSGRDARMNREILESAKFPEIVFTPTQIKGAVATSGASKVEVSGTFRLHGQDHEVTIPVEVVADAGKLQVAVHFVIPYVAWGLKNPSTFILRASDKVEIDIHATGRIDAASASP